MYIIIYITFSLTNIDFQSHPRENLEYKNCFKMLKYTEF